MLSIICEINFILTWTGNCVIACNTAAAQETTFTITDTKLYVPVVTLSTWDNTKLLQQLNCWKHIINWNKGQ